MDHLIYAIYGFLFGLFAKFLYEWSLNRREARIIRQSLLIEILYMHQDTQRLLLENYKEKYNSQKFLDSDLGSSFWRPSYVINIYENNITMIDRLLGSDICLQLHYYYSLLRDLNNKSAEDDAQVNKDFVIEYLRASAHAYAIGNGAVECILGSPEAKKSMQDAMVSLLETFDDKGHRESIAQLLRKYAQNGAANSILTPPQEQRSKSFLKRRLF